MEIVESVAPVVEECELPIPRGGPIYVPNLVGLCTRVAEFENSIVSELQNLEAELHQDTFDLCDDDISWVTENNENHPPTLD
ncbi:hypothetical protein QN277_029197 [Acacia crassicarpa]|uniref:Uncharacterized protein n=1 Tax=Acacia crassicarpa TaxID=499986 RepID=A0AAE1J4T7_9FABA|nr:hypothetical protein QN277_029197 [Acacia crassicarpa]